MVVAQCTWPVHSNQPAIHQMQNCTAALDRTIRPGGEGLSIDVNYETMTQSDNQIEVLIPLYIVEASFFSSNCIQTQILSNQIRLPKPFSVYCKLHTGSQVSTP